MHLFRWLVLIVTVVGAWCLVFALALFAPIYIEHHFCPPDYIVQFDSCINESTQLAMGAAFIVAVALSVVVAVLLAAALAPSHKRGAVWTTLVVSTAFVGAFAFVGNGAWVVFLPAAVGGTLCAAALTLVVRS